MPLRDVDSCELLKGCIGAEQVCGEDAIIKLLEPRNDEIFCCYGKRMLSYDGEMYKRRIASFAPAFGQCVKKLAHDDTNSTFPESHSHANAERGVAPGTSLFI